MKLSKACLLIFISLAVLSCKKTDDDSVELPTEQEKILAPEFTCTINGDFFEGTTVFSRYQSNGRLAISATDTQGSNLYFSINYFVGNGIYPVSAYSFPDEEPIVKLMYISNSDTTYYRSKSYNYPNSGNIDLNSYSENPPVVGGLFQLTMVEVDNMQNEFVVENGIFSDILIMPKLSSSEPGVITYWQNGKKYSSSISEAILFEGMFYALTFHPENEPTERYRYYQNIISDNQPYNFSWFYHNWYQGPSSESTFDIFGACFGMGANVAYSIDNGSFTGSAGSYSRDFEMYFEDIPITVVADTDMSNKLGLNTPEGVIIFTEIDTFQYDLSGEKLKITIRASNDQGQKLKATCFNFQFITYNDCDVSIETYVSIINPDGSEMTYRMKCINQRNLNTGLTQIAGDGFGFESFDDFNPWIYGKDIPYTIVY